MPTNTNHLGHAKDDKTFVSMSKRGSINPPRRSSLNKELKITNINQSTEVVLKAGLS